MLFNSIQFLIFFLVVTSLYFALPHKYRWLLLLAASCYFYMSFIPVFILILWLTITVDYFSGIYIEKSEGQRKKLYLILSIITNIGVLFVFKYFNFFNQNLSSLAALLDWNYSLRSLSLILPIGLSFHTFQSLAYTIEVYRGHQKAERNYGILALYVLFYPQLVAGPIERPQNLLHQFYEKHYFDFERIVSGLRLMLWGFFKKAVIADRLSLVVNQVFNDVGSYNGLYLLLAVVFFAFQIYCDFSGYTDIARGAARVMGFELMVNFRQPYYSRSIPEFWHRWHISLSSWFREYLYIPLGGSRVSRKRYYFNLLATFLLSGFWHGANWTFLVWGALHGCFMIMSVSTSVLRQKITSGLGLDRFPALHQALQISMTFSLVSFGWIFFRANSFSDAIYVISHIFTGWETARLFTLIGKPQLLILGLSVLALEMIHLLQIRKNIKEFIYNRPVWLRWSGYLALTLWILYFGVFEKIDFIYFRF